MHLEDELQTLVDELYHKSGISWHLALDPKERGVSWQSALDPKGKRPRALRVVKRRGGTIGLKKSFGALVRYAKLKHIPLVMNVEPSVGNKAFIVGFGFKQYPGSKWGKLWVILPPKNQAPKGRIKNPKKVKPKTTKSKTRYCKKTQFPPPFKKLTRKRAKKLIERFKIHANPDPPACEICGLKYKQLKTGLNFASVQDMMFVETSDPEFWRQKGRHSVLGLWNEIKRSMWRDHLEMCEDTPAQEIYLEKWEY